MKRLLLALVIVAVFGASEARAEFRQIDLTVFGMDWAICAHAVSVSIQKLPGVESVKVSLHEGRARIALEAGNSLTLGEIREAVERNGFTPRQAEVTATADLTSKGDQLQLAISGVKETYQVQITPHQQDVTAHLKSFVGKSVTIEGVVPAPAKKQQLAMQVKTIKPAGEKVR